MIRRHYPLLCVLTACFIFAAPLPLHADTASVKLARYKSQVDEAVDSALEWLAKNQHKDGYFAGVRGRTNAVVSLTVMAFLCKGHTPGNGDYGEVINKAIDYILAHQNKKNGTLDTGYGGGGMYSHCISTLMLSEVSGMLTPERQKKVDKVLAKALKIILSAQAVKKNASLQGGWRYKLNSRDSDISVTGWALMALRSARLNGARIPRESIEDAMKYIGRCQNKDGGFGYNPRGGSGAARTGTGLLALALTGQHNSPQARKAGDYLLRMIKRYKFIRERHFYYGLYYTSQAMFQLGGDYWDTYAQAMYEHVLKTQDKQGYWKAGSQLAYPTAMTVLALGVVYRQLPIYQR
jgi:prenyltransferase/squalene oxidase-like repeat protein